ncbi:phlebovirus glycoprotein G1 [Ancylostoma duodenale]|uniref:Phlebovirus glycoprotein G1 n=1 Tax=Ancylostoma duodenale TaxID=51022 RepID=A0A0C2FMB3_9BILA|nr:phlebovirus glycoprotein G1 [Ancylostoma duodenale]
MDQLQRGIIEKVPSEAVSSPAHYLSHHGVIKKEGDDIKIRCVYNGSAKTKGNLSLNDSLYRGPVLLPDLAGILLRIRFYRILISSDIEKAFLMVGLHVDSRDYTRFLWLNDPTRPLIRDNVVTYRFTRVPFGLISSPFLLAGTIHHHLTTTATPISQAILRNTYVDNVFYGFKNSTKTSSSLRGEPCECPDWAIACSFSNSEKTTNSKIAAIPTSLRNYQPPHVCSFTRSPNCSSTTRIDVFNQIQLYDNTTLLVENLNIDIKEYLDKSDFICINHNGKKVKIHPTRRLLTGTSFFCEHHRCYDRALLFCTYDNPLAILVTNESNHSMPIILKAWGTIAKTYYGYINNSAEDHPTTTPETRIQVYSECTKDGLKVTSNSTIETLEACIQTYCAFLQHVTSQVILFPNSLIMYNYQVSVRAWKEDKILFKEQVNCHAYPICEILQCTTCWEWIYNSHCWTYMQVAYAVIAGISIVLLTPILYIFCELLHFMMRLLYLLFTKLCSRPRSMSFKTLRSKESFKRYINRRHTSKRKWTACTIMKLLQVYNSDQCAQFTSITAQETLCTISNNSETCTFNEATMMTLQPLQQETCLALKDHNNVYIGMISVKVYGIYYKCQKRVEFYSRDHEFITESSHRCYRAGSCKENTCENTKPTDKLEEFSRAANDHPGYTFCSSSCGCVTCDGCFFCNPSCLFYRCYAKPTTQSAYKIYTCPTWDLIVRAEITIKKGSSAETKRITLHPGATTAWNNIRFTLIGTVVPQLPILSATFMTNLKNTAVVEPAHKGQLIPNTIGQFQCSTLSNSKQFRCQFTSKCCTCSKGIQKATCICSDGNLTKHMTNSRLPLAGKNFLLYKRKMNLYAKVNIGSTLQMQIVAENLAIRLRMHKGTCFIQVSELEGCYSCLAGATLGLVC